MKVHIEYECEICGNRYREEESAKECEARGKSPSYPEGLLEADLEGGFYGVKYAFAVAHTTSEGHICLASLWACRDTATGDSLGDETCGSQHSFHPSEFRKSWLKHPPMKRLIAWLEGQGIEPKVCVEGKIVTLKEAVKGRK